MCWECRTFPKQVKADATVKMLGACSRWAPRGRRVRHAEKEQSVKARNRSWAQADFVGPELALPITGSAGKWQGVCEWGGWGRLSVDGPGQNNPDRSEGPWGRAACAPLEWRCVTGRGSSTSIEGNQSSRSARRVDANRNVQPASREGPPEKPALEPY